MRRTADFRTWCLWLLLIVPFAGYLANVLHYVVNVPFWDDYSAFLAPLARFSAAERWIRKLQILCRPHNGFHPFVLERSILLLQAAFGEVRFDQFVILGNLGWMATCALMLSYFWRVMGVPLGYLVPIPYLMLATSHFEAIDFASAGFEFYWGGGLFAVSSLMLAIHGRGLWSVLCFALALSSFGGGLALLPLLVTILASTRQWKALALLAAVAGVLLAFYLSVYPAPPGDGLAPLLEHPIGVLRYVLIFVGNDFSTGRYDLSSLNTLHACMGALVLFATALVAWRGRGIGIEQGSEGGSERGIRHGRGLWLPLAVVVYVLILATMAALVRFDLQIAPRYGAFALLAAAALYGGAAFLLTRRPGGLARAAAAVIAVAAVGSWTYTLYITQPQFRERRQERLESMALYLKGDVAALRRICWDAAYADRALQDAASRGLYDARHFERHDDR